ncbi:nitric oxide synthase [Macrococcus hajekii]|uniref:Nitric oxide synthase n=1 Tax=Macrococcus hajekii TaxID=198482 RepID=A0A4R6BID1_9STAP|nr:nitric oxide synthase oxygenase [Macrococcus hajekii]TDM01327.1 nitric oxide synthase [Macrococcus hajekii]GGB10724.1 nitric oxide synthase oxygenase [Macrococcus hajekii]
MYDKAEIFIRQMHDELEFEQAVTEQRLLAIKEEIKKTGSYHHTAEELEYGTRVAWRNSNRCIGRLFWDKLKVIDKRDISDCVSFEEAVTSHIVEATNSGKIRPTITIFPQATAHEVPFIILNDQLIRYASDPLAEPIRQLVPKIENRFLPIVYRHKGEMHRFSLPDNIVLEVPLIHPDYPDFSKLNLSWYAVPFISGMELRIGGITYPCAPFNGWYMESEIASRNLLDCYRYNLIEEIADSFHFDRSKTATYWRDKTLVELNYAVYHSYKSQGVAIVDHYTASKQFEKFEQQELQSGRKVTGDWTWLIPPISPSLVHNFHKGYDNTYHDPNFYYRKKGCPFSGQRTN